MNEYLLLLKGDAMNHLSPDELQNMLSDCKAWITELGDQYIGGQRLDEEGAVLSSKSDVILTDGPFLESKEIIAGFFWIAAKDQEDAVKIAKASAHYKYYTIEVRPIAFPKMK